MRNRKGSREHADYLGETQPGDGGRETAAAVTWSHDLGGDPRLVDFIVWIWRGRPSPP